MVSNNRVARAMIQLIEGAVARAFCSAPTAIIGAIKTIRKIMVRVICICWTSLVDLVIREAVENLLNSETEKLSTLVNTSCLISRAKPVAILEAKKPTRTAQIAPSNVTTNINQPW